MRNDTESASMDNKFDVTQAFLDGWFELIDNTGYVNDRLYGKPKQIITKEDGNTVLVFDTYDVNKELVSTDNGLSLFSLDKRAKNCTDTTIEITATFFAPLQTAVAGQPVFFADFVEDQVFEFNYYPSTKIQYTTYVDDETFSMQSLKDVLEMGLLFKTREHAELFMEQVLRRFSVTTKHQQAKTVNKMLNFVGLN